MRNSEHVEAGATCSLAGLCVIQLPQHLAYELEVKLESEVDSKDGRRGVSLGKKRGSTSVPHPAAPIYHLAHSQTFCWPSAGICHP